MSSESFVSCPTWIRTKTDSTKNCSATVTPLDSSRVQRYKIFLYLFNFDFVFLEILNLFYNYLNNNVL